MPTICPTITATSIAQYKEQIEAVKGFAAQLHIDLMDGKFAPTVSPKLEEVWWPDGLKASLHLMYAQPGESIKKLIELKPSMVIVHLESEVYFPSFCQELHEAGIQCGLALLPDTKVEESASLLPLFDQLLIFSGHLGYHGGQVDLDLAIKIAEAKSYKNVLQIAWDGGINDTNARALVERGVEVLNVGGFIQSAADPKAAYDKIQASLGQN